jgi:diaminopimelate epimerase
MITFYKYQGTGNDFILLDNRNNSISLSEEKINQLCNRRMGIGADGLMLLQTKSGFDFEMIYYNADGKIGSMCGNGGRCISQFAKDIGIEKKTLHFLAVDGPHESFFAENGWVHLKMQNVNTVQKSNADFILNTGSPHFIKLVNNVTQVNVFTEGRTIRNNDDFIKEGINVNFVQKESDKIIVRTYERGVEDETYSCGTGVTASALVCAHQKLGKQRIEISTLGGYLAVEFNKISDNTFEDIWLCGPATFVFKGSFEM